LLETACLQKAGNAISETLHLKRCFLGHNNNNNNNNNNNLYFKWVYKYSKYNNTGFQFGPLDTITTDDNNYRTILVTIEKTDR